MSKLPIVSIRIEVEADYPGLAGKLYGNIERYVGEKSRIKEYNYLGRIYDINSDLRHRRFERLIRAFKGWPDVG